MNTLAKRLLLVAFLAALVAAGSWLLGFSFILTD
jgi:hypothetical protein